MSKTKKDTRKYHEGETMFIEFDGINTKMCVMAEKIVGFCPSGSPGQTALWAKDDGEEFILNETYEEVKNKIIAYSQNAQYIATRVLSKLEVLIDYEVKRTAERTESI